MSIDHHSLNARSELLRVAALVILCVLVWCAIMNRWTVATWQTPLEYTENPARSGDTLYYFAEVKAAADGHYWPLLSKQVPELGAPFGAQWNDFPTIEEFIIFVAGLFARVMGVFAACNLMTMFAHLLAALSIYGVCRSLRCDWAWSFAAAVAFGFATFAFAHGEHHLDIAYYWHVPLALLVCRWLTTSQGLAMHGSKMRAALAIALVTGLQNQYYTFMFVQLAALGGLVQWLRRRDWRAVLPAVAVSAAAIAGFVFVNVDTLVFRFRHGPNPAVLLRFYSQMDFYALKIADLFVPFPGHRIFSGLANYYFAHVLIQGEMPPAAYLGLVGIAGVFVIAMITFVRLAAKPGLTIPLEGAQILWIILQSTVGGINSLIGLFGFQLFRATTRYSIFILALALIFLVRWLSSVSKGRPVVAGVGAALLALVAIVDQTPPMTTTAEIHQIARVVSSDKAFTQEMESRLPGGAMIFQLPVVDFPETSAGENISGYDHFRPYLFAGHLRFSYGSDKGRPRDDWPHDLNGLSLNDAIDTLERYGFAAIYVSRNGYEDKGEQLFKEFKEMGRDDIVQSPLGDLFCVFLKPSPHPVLPSRTSR